MYSKYTVDLEVEVETTQITFYSSIFCSKHSNMGTSGKNESTLKERKKKSQNSHTQSGQRVCKEEKPVLPACFADWASANRLGSLHSYIRNFPQKYVEDIEFL